GGVVWTLWSFALGIFMVGEARYVEMQNAGLFLKQPRYPAFVVQWIVMLFVLAIVMAHLYAWARGTSGAGPKTALKVGFLVGFVGGFPMSFAQAAWSPIPRIFPLSWMLEIWIGAILATLVAGFLYKD
ncbi:MAG TPA: hypothetical protein VGF08_12210, partial [Terriglobales bacterium]